MPKASAQARHNMIENQLKPNEVTDERLLAAIGAVPREAFVPSHLKPVAYIDEDLRLPEGGFLIEPLAFGRLAQAARLRPSDVVLVIGDVTGYVSAVLAQLAGTLLHLVDDETAKARVETRLNELDLSNYFVHIEPDALQGYPEQAPFDIIFVVGKLTEVPDALKQQLAERGRMLLVVDRGRIGKAVVALHEHGVVVEEEIADAQTPPFPGTQHAAREAFVF